jgi:hypothetical protein
MTTTMKTDLIGTVVGPNWEPLMEAFDSFWIRSLGGDGQPFAMVRGVFRENEKTWLILENSSGTIQEFEAIRLKIRRR